MTMSVQGFAPMPARAPPSYPTQRSAAHPRQPKKLGAGTYGERELLKMRAALVLLVSSAALPLRAPARGPSRLSTCNKPWKGCPGEGGSRLGEKLADFSEAMVMYEEDGSKSDESGSASTWTGENGLDRAAPKALATSPAATALRQLYKNSGADGSTSDKSGSASAWTGENGLDRAAPKALATSPAATALRQLYKNLSLIHI